MKSYAREQRGVSSLFRGNDRLPCRRMAAAVDAALADGTRAPVKNHLENRKYRPNPSTPKSEADFFDVEISINLEVIKQDAAE